MLILQNFDNIAERDAKKEVQLVIIRFFSVLLSQSRTTVDPKSDDQVRYIFCLSIEIKSRRCSGLVYVLRFIMLSLRVFITGKAFCFGKHFILNSFIEFFIFWMRSFLSTKKGQSGHSLTFCKARYLLHKGSRLSFVGVHMFCL